MKKDSFCVYSNGSGAMAKYICVICGFIYDEDEGHELDGIAPGTLWKDVPDDWYCPDCGATKDHFELMES